jgi:hypothetical protein
VSIFPSVKSHENTFRGSRVEADRQTDRQREMFKGIGAFFKFVVGKALEKKGLAL